VKRKTFYHISLSLPYIALLISGAFTYLANGFEIFEASSTPTVLAGTLIFFSVSAIVWAPLYTWMVAAMLFWGRGKNADEVRGMYLLSPVLLACAMGIPALLVSIPYSAILLLWGFLHMNNLDFILPALFKNYDAEQSLSVGLAWAFMAALCVVIGYVFVGGVLLIERVMKKRGVFRDTEDVGGMPTPR
jgi:hypothetical protein